MRLLAARKKCFRFTAGNTVGFKHAHDFFHQRVIKNPGLFRANLNADSAAHAALGCELWGIFADNTHGANAGAKPALCTDIERFGPNVRRRR